MKRSIKPRVDWLAGLDEKASRAGEIILVHKMLIADQRRAQTIRELIESERVTEGLPVGLWLTQAAVALAQYREWRAADKAALNKKNRDKCFGSIDAITAKLDSIADMFPDLRERLSAPHRKLIDDAQQRAEALWAEINERRKQAGFDPDQMKASEFREIPGCVELWDHFLFAIEVRDRLAQSIPIGIEGYLDSIKKRVESFESFKPLEMRDAFVINLCAVLEFIGISGRSRCLAVAAEILGEAGVTESPETLQSDFRSGTTARARLDAATNGAIVPMAGSRKPLPRKCVKKV